MNNTVFNAGIEFTYDAESVNHNFFENGMDKVEFLISTNPGEPLKPLSKIASGGEMSRIMLAIKTVLAKVDSIPTLIF
jgi:DNA repair protein RecN (Recombination protein N)